MDREFAIVLYRALCMLTRYLEKRFGFGSHVELNHSITQENKP